MKPERFQNKTLSFKCGVDIDSMPNIDGGKYCTLCQQNVIDFTGKSYKEFLEITKDKKKYCGIYYEEQVEDLYEIKNPLKIPFLAGTIGLLFNINNANSTTINIKSNIEQSINQENSINTFSDSTNTNVCKEDLNSLEYARKHKIIETNKRIYYFTKQFPFIKSRRSRVRLAGF